MDSDQNTFAPDSPELSGHVSSSGGVAISGATVSANYGGGSDTTDSNGYYELTVPYNWSGTVTPSKSGFGFTPSSKSYSNVTNDDSEEDYTGGDIVPPGNVSSFTAVAGETQVRLTWSNPGDSDFSGVKIMRKTGGYPSNKDDGTQVYDGSGTEKFDTGLSNGTKYYYKAFSYDTSGNYASGSSASATPYEILTHFVSPSGLHAWPYASWSSAATHIQTAINMATFGDTVMVGDGTYNITSEIGINTELTIKS